MSKKNLAWNVILCVAVTLSWGCERAEAPGEPSTRAEPSSQGQATEPDEPEEEEPPPPPGHSMESIFASLDWDEDGMIDCGELRQSECFGNGGELFAEEVGYTTPLSPAACSRNEACAALLARGMEFDETLITRDELVTAFMQLDTDGDGVVSCAEVPDAAVCVDGDENSEVAFNDCIGDMGCQMQIPFDGWPGAAEDNDEDEEEEPALDATGQEEEPAE